MNQKILSQIRIWSIALLTLVAAHTALGASFTWDPSTTGTGSDGAGAWNTTLGNWSNGTDHIWSNADLTDTAVIGNGSGAAGTITIGTTIDLGGITFNPAGSGNYTVTGSTITLAGSSSIITNAASATIGSVLAGGVGLTTSGTGSLTLTGANTYTGTTTISAGSTLQLGNGGNFANTPLAGNIVDNGNLVYDYSSTSYGSLTSTNGITGSGNLSFTGGGASVNGSYYHIDFNGNINLGGSQTYTQADPNTSGQLYEGFGVATSSTLTGSSITMYGDIGKFGGNGNTLALDTSAANGPINLNISLGRANVWYNLTSFTANSGTGTITVAGTGPSSSGWAGTPVTLTGGVVSIAANVNSAVAVTLNPALSSTASGAFSGTMSLTKGGVGPLTLTGSNTYTGNTSITSGTLQIGATGSLGTSGTYAGTISDSGGFVYGSGANLTLSSAISGAGSLIMSGPSTLTLTAAGGYAGPITITSGTLKLNNGSNNQINQNNTTVGAGGTLQNVGAVVTLGNPGGNAINLTGGTLSGSNSDTTNGVFYLYGVTNVSGGTQSTINANRIFTANSFNVSAGSTLAISSQILNTLTDTGAGTIVLTGSTTGLTATTGPGTLQIGDGTTDGFWGGNISDGGAVVYNIIGNQTYGSVISGTGALTKTGAGTVTLTGANTNSGVTTISGGTLQVGNGGSTGSLTSGTFVDNGALVYNLNSTASATAPSGGTAISGSGSLSITAGGGGTGTSYADINFFGNVTLGGSQTYIQVGSDAGANAFEGIQLLANTTLTGSSISMSGDAGGATGNGVYSLAMNTSAANGPINLNISLGRGTVWYNLSSFTANSGTGTISVAGTGPQSSGWNSTPVTLTGGVVNVATSVSSNTAVTINPSLTSLVSGSFTGTMSLAKGGAGTLILTSTGNTYSGGTTINAGTLQLGDGVSNNGTMPGNVTDKGTLAFANPFAQTYAGVISGTGAVTASGPGTVTLTSANSFSGGTTVSAGRLVELNNGSVLGTGTTAISSGATLELSNTTGTAIAQNAGTFTGAGTIQKTGTGTIAIGGAGNVNVSLSPGGLIDVEGGYLAGSSSFQGVWTNNKGSLNIASGATFDGVEGTIIVDALTGAGTLAGGYSGTRSTTIGIANGSGTFSGVIQNSVVGGGTLSLTKAGTGTEILSGSNTYTGGTTISGGTLIVSGSLSGTASASVASGATIEVDGLLNHSATTTVAGTLQGTGSVGPVTANGGVLAPGLTAANSTTTSGVLTAGGAVTLSSTTNFDIRLGVLSSGTDSDQLASTGAVTLNDASLQLTLGSGMANLTAANVNHLFYVLINGGAGSTGTGTDIFSGLAQGATVNAGGGFTFTIEYAENSTGTGSGTDVGLELTAVPEPGTWGSILIGFGLLLGIQRSRRRPQNGSR